MRDSCFKMLLSVFSAEAKNNGAVALLGCAEYLELTPTSVPHSRSELSLATWPRCPKRELQNKTMAEIFEVSPPRRQEWTHQL